MDKLLILRANMRIIMLKEKLFLIFRSIILGKYIHDVHKHTCATR